MMGKRGVRLCSSSALRRRSVVLLLLCVVMATAEILKIVDPKCLSIGGICVDENSCPQESRANESGLCAQDESRKGACCFRTPDDVSCRDHGGRCGGHEECSKVKNFGTLDCKDGTQCCLLIY
ncbi:U-scoloptoxin(19)-Tl1a-like [Argiope bruennichi]|uniref:Carboxypeptidase inhibitor n=1 Tax=Argiope bruennichi TaxID=94029 RepID=A0A8T0FH58_ARGBR|nr:U-scoloptoxin(19)-Tl1a-like [Argiope bruennichi]KAF8790617.1 hypothetical protein HNY73_005611 [Argiope bruennichi]